MTPPFITSDVIVKPLKKRPIEWHVYVPPTPKPFKKRRRTWQMYNEHLICKKLCKENFEEYKQKQDFTDLSVINNIKNIRIWKWLQKPYDSVAPL